MPKKTKKTPGELEALKRQFEKFTEANRKNQREYKKRRRDKGEVLVALWVPKRRVEELKQIARAMCLEKPKSKKDPFGAPVIPVTGKTPGWAYIKADRDEVWLHMVLKANKAQWQNKTKKHPNTWRIRSDLVKELGLAKRVVATEEVGTKKKKTTKKAPKRTSRKKAAQKATTNKTPRKNATIK